MYVMVFYVQYKYFSCRECYEELLDRRRVINRMKLSYWFVIIIDSKRHIYFYPHDVTEIFLKVALCTITPPNQTYRLFECHRYNRNKCHEWFDVTNEITSKNCKFCWQSFGFTVIFYRRNTFLHSDKIEDSNIFHLYEKFYIIYHCSMTF